MAKLDMMAVAQVMREVAAEEILPRWRNLAKSDIHQKDDRGGLVTVADHAAELALAARLEPMLPGSRVVGEEAVAADAGVLELFKGTGAVWVVDPIDGTSKFANGLTTFDVMVALVVDGVPLAGWILAPAEDVLYLGEAGSGAEWHEQGRASRVAAPAGLGLDAQEGVLGAGAFVNRGKRDPTGVKDRFRGYTRPICAGHNYGRLFRGESHFLVNFSTFAWDHLPGLAIGAAAGFHGARHDGRTFDPLDSKGGLLVAPDPTSWTAIHQLLLGE